MQNTIFEMLCKYNIDPSFVAVGTGDTYTQSKRRFEFRATDHKNIVAGTAQYAIKYFDAQKIYILWKVRCQTSKDRYVRRSIFSLDADPVLDCLGKTVLLRKGVEFAWRRQETVRVFNLEGLEAYIAEHLSKIYKMEEKV